MEKFKCTFVGLLILLSSASTYSTQRPGQGDSDDGGSPFLDMASSFLQETLANQNGGGGGGGGGAGLAGIASIIGTLMQGDGSSGKSSENGAAQIIGSIGSMIASANGGNGFDPSIIGNVIEMFSGGSDSSSSNRKKRSNEGSGLDTILTIAQAFMANNNNNNNDNQGRKMNSNTGGNNDNLMSLLPMVMQAISSFTGPEMEKTQEKHKDHSWVLPPFLENLHVMWDHFSNSELAEALWMKMGLNNVFKGFVGRDGKLDYDKLFDSLENQSFRRRWIKSATIFLSDWANYLADPEVYQRYISTGQMMANGFLQSQGYPKQAFLDINRPSETLSTLIDTIAQRHLMVKIVSVTYVKPAVNYIKDLLKLGQARGLLKKFNSTELSDKLTDTLNLEVIEPVLRVHRAYRYAIQTPHCDKFVLCEINSHDPNEQLGLGGFKSGVTKFGSMAAAWFISAETHTPFWTLFAIINDPYQCENKHPVDCTSFHDGEAKVTTEYIHNEL